MTYKLEPGIIEKIQSPVTLILPDKEELFFRKAIDLVNTSFDRAYVISSIRAHKDTVVIELTERPDVLVPFD